MMNLKDYIVEHIETWPIVEAAMSRDRFKNKVENYICQIIENYVLIRYAQLCGTNSQKQRINHWIRELNSYVKDLHRSSVSVSKERAYLAGLENTGIDDSEMIRREYEDKLEEEGIELEDIPFEIWNETLTFIWKKIPEIICLPKHNNTKIKILKLMRICDFPLSYVSKTGEEKVIYVDSSDYVKYISGEKNLDEAFGHYLDKQTMESLRAYEETNGRKNL